MQKIDNISRTSTSTMFQLRGNKVFFMDYISNKILTEMKFEANPEFFELKSHFSPNKKLYVVYSTSEFAVFDMNGDVILRNSGIKSLCKAGFLEHSDRFFLTIVKQPNFNYLLTVYLFLGKSLQKVDSFEIGFFKPSFEYIRFDQKSGLIAVQTRPQTIELYSENKERLFLEDSVDLKTQIVSFLLRPNTLLVVADDLKDEKPTISVSVYRVNPKLVLEHKRVFNNVQEAKLLSNSDASIILVNAHRFMDTTGNSYYGLEKVFFYNSNTKHFDDVVSFKGNIHDVKIDANEKNFAVISGSVPSFTVLYDAKNSPIHLLSHDFRNQIYFAPNKAFVALAGFGSLNGEIEIWNYAKREPIGFCSSSCASFLKWSSDSAYFVTAIVVDKLKVDHRFSVFQYNGVLVKRINCDVFDLINVDFGFWKETDLNIINAPQKRAKENGLVPIKHKMEAQKLNSERIKNYIPGDNNPVKVNPKPTLSVGNPSSGNSAFFNSKQGDRVNKFKKQ